MIDGQQKISAKSRLARILWSKPTVDTPIAPVDLVKIFIEKENEKHGKWSSLRTVLTFDP